MNNVLKQMKQLFQRVKIMNQQIFACLFDENTWIQSN